MPIHLIIDGYNLLGVRGGLRGDVEAKREALIRDLAGYRQRKGHPVTVVFDGWRSGNSRYGYQAAGGKLRLRLRGRVVGS